MGRLIIVTGKGGVGKTSVAAAHAIASSLEGKKTLLISTDKAHNLGDIFQTRVGSRIKNIGADLSLLELSSYEYVKKNFSDIQKALVNLFGNSSVIYQLGSNFTIPGIDPLFALLNIKEIYDKGNYDRIIVDCAPTGETLSLLKLPELLSGYMEKFFPVGKKVLRLLSPVAKLKYRVSLPDKKALNDLEKMHSALIELEEFLKNPDICSLRLVCVPEKMIVEETKRSFMYLNLYRYPVDAVFVNRVLSPDIENLFMKGWRDIQKKYMEELEAVFSGMEMIKIPWYPEEIRGMEAIKRVSKGLLKRKDLFDIKIRENIEEYRSVDGGYLLFIPLPVMRGTDVEVVCNHRDINIRMNNFNRCIPLPNSLYNSESAKVEVQDEGIKIFFRVSKTVPNDL